MEILIFFCFYTFHIHMNVSFIHFGLNNAVLTSMLKKEKRNTFSFPLYFLFFRLLLLLFSLCSVSIAFNPESILFHSDFHSVLIAFYQIPERCRCHFHSIYVRSRVKILLSSIYRMLLEAKIKRNIDTYNFLLCFFFLYFCIVT